MSMINQTNLITDYINFISTAKTERLCVDEAERLAVLAGFRQYKHSSGILMPGEKVYLKGYEISHFKMENYDLGD